MKSIYETPIIHDRHLVKQWIETILQRDDYKNAFKMPKNLTIITCRNEGPMTERLVDSLIGWVEISVLEKSLEYLGIEGLVVLKDDRLPWRNTFKFEMLHNYLNSGKCNTEYFMCCDAIDVIFKKDPQEVIDIFESFNCEALFMSTPGLDGYSCMPEVKRFVDKINGNSGRYLNSGVYIGRTEFVKEVISEAMNYAIPHGVTMDKYKEYLNSSPKNYPKGSQDQDIFRYIEPKFYPRMKVDYQNLMAYRS
jgi:hypothetical protein